METQISSKTCLEFKNSMLMNHVATALHVSERCLINQAAVHGVVILICLPSRDGCFRIPEILFIVFALFICRHLITATLSLISRA